MINQLSSAQKSRRWEHLPNTDSTGLEQRSLRSQCNHASVVARMPRSPRGYGFAKRLPHKEISRRKIPSAYFWCGRRDLNPYSVNHTPLKRARLPVPPLPHIKHLCFITRRRSPRFTESSLPRTFDIIHHRKRFVNTFFENS